MCAQALEVLDALGHFTQWQPIGSRRLDGTGCHCHHADNQVCERLLLHNVYTQQLQGPSSLPQCQQNNIAERDGQFSASMDLSRPGHNARPAVLNALHSRRHRGAPRLPGRQVTVGRPRYSEECTSTLQSFLHNAMLTTSALSQAPAAGVTARLRGTVPRAGGSAGARSVWAHGTKRLI